MALEQLKTMTVVVADTGDFESELNWNMYLSPISILLVFVFLSIISL